MSKIAVVYWSGTGNTEKMAAAVAVGAQTASLSVETADPTAIASADAIALGCPSMGDEVLEESIMEPFVTTLEPLIAGKPLVLFGSYGWGDGSWMADWEERMKQAGANLLQPGLICQEAPDDATLENCRTLGKKLSAAIAALG